MSTSKTVFLCCGGRKTRGLKPSACRQAPPGGLRKLGSTVTIGLERDTLSRGREVTIRLVQDTMPPRSPYCGEDDPGFVAGREKIEELYGDESLRDYYVLQWTNPEHCHWSHTLVEVQGAAGDGDIARPMAVSMPGVPSGDMDAEEIIPGAGAEQLVRVMDIRAVPGEYMSPVTRYESSDGVLESRGQGMTMATPCLCGGRVVSISEDAEGLPVYTVGLPGVNGRLDRMADVYASDHVRYGVGDWVFVLTFSSDCLACDLDPSHDPTAVVTHESTADEGGVTDEETDETPAEEDVETPFDRFARDGGFVNDNADNSPTAYETSLRDTSDRSPRTPERSAPPELSGGVIVPLLCGRYYSQSAAMDAWEVAPAQRLIEVLNWCVRRGVIIDINPSGSVDVEMPWGRAESLPVHYHCPGQGATNGGFRAFRENDEVLVIGQRDVPGSALAVLAHGDGKPRPCTEYLVISMGVTTKNGDVYYTVFDLLANAEAADIPNGSGGYVTFPCRDYELAHWLSITNSVSAIDQMDNLNGAPRIGKEHVNGWTDDAPRAGRLCADLECTPPETCDTLTIYQPSGAELTLGGNCGHCETSTQEENPYSGYLPHDRAEFETIRSVELRQEGDGENQWTEWDYEEWTRWLEDVPYIQTPYGQPPRPSSILCTWGDVTRPVQVRSYYRAERERYYSTDDTNNVMHFREVTDYTMTFPLGGVQTWQAVSRTCRAISDSSDATPLPGATEDEATDCNNSPMWEISDQYVVLAGFGVRTEFSAAAVFVAVTRPWTRQPLIEPSKVRLDGFFQLNGHCYASYGPQQSEQGTDNPFATLSLSVGLASCVERLVHRALIAVDWAGTYEWVSSADDVIADLEFNWEVRA